MQEFKNVTHLDANQYGVFATNQLNYILKQTYDVLYPQLTALKYIPVSYETPNWAKTITFESFNRTGLAKIIASYADDLPRSDVKGTMNTVNVRDIGNAFGYNIREIVESQIFTIPLDVRRAQSARFANDQKVNQLAYFGDEEHGLQGFLNNPNIPRADVAANGTGSTTQWVNKTPIQILNDMNALVTGVTTLTKGVETPDTLILPLKQYVQIQSTPFSPTFTGQTILDYFLKNNPFIKNVVAAVELEGAGTGGDDIMIAYENNVNKLALHIPQEYTQQPPEKRNLEYVINATSRFGGVIVYYPLSVSIGEGI